MPRRETFSHIDEPAAVGRRLREAREERGLSQRELSFPGCTAAYISRIEKGERAPSLQILREFARRLGVSESYLARGEDEEHDPLLDAEVALRLDDLDLAQQLFENAVENERTRPRALAGLGQLAFRRGDTHGAIDLLEQSLELREAELSEDDPTVVDALGRAYAMAAEFESAIALFERHLARAEQKQDLLETVRFAVLLANTLIDSGNFVRAEEVLGHVMAVAGDSRDPLVRARLLWSQSRLHALQNDQATAARYARRALELLELTEHTYYAARAHQLLAYIELERGHASEALELLERGLPLVEQTGSPYERAVMRLDEARALLQLGRREEAAAIAMETSSVLRDANPHEAARSYAVVADIFAQLGDRARAIELYELAAEMLEGTPTRWLIDVYARLAELLEADGRKDQALELLKRAMTLQRETTRPLRGQ